MKKYQKKVKHGMRRQLTDREEHGQPSSVLPNICWRDDSPIFEWSVIPEIQCVCVYIEGYMIPTSS